MGEKRSEMVKIPLAKVKQPQKGELTQVRGWVMSAKRAEGPKAAPDARKNEGSHPKRSRVFQK